jgi:transcriptional regulator with XRE-family HTH domain
MSEYRTKIQEEYIYHGAGYEVILHHVPMIEVGDEWVFNINLSIVDRMVFESIPEYDWRLTGYQVRFIRSLVDMTLKEFSERFGVSHPAVKKWENAKNGPTNMSWCTEKDIRLFVLMHCKAKPEEFQKCYLDLIPEATGEPKPIHIDIEKLAIV